MSQTYTEDCFAASHAGLTDLQNMEDNFHSLKTLFSGSSAPANSTGGMPWFDTAKKILKLRNSTNGAWLGVHYSSTAARWFVYENSAGDGWIIDSSVADRVLSVKSTAGVYASVGFGGSWDITGLIVSDTTKNHTHIQHDHLHVYDTIYVVPDSTGTGGGQYLLYNQSSLSGGGELTSIESTTHDHGVICTGGWRPAAAIGTLQYLDL